MIVILAFETPTVQKTAYHGSSINTQKLDQAKLCFNSHLIKSKVHLAKTDLSTVYLAMPKASHFSLNSDSRAIFASYHVFVSGTHEANGDIEKEQAYRANY